jgi:hypothetical protein
MGINYNARVVSDGLLACWDAGNGRSASSINRNIITFPEAYDNGFWYKDNCTVVSNDILAPDGSQTADRIVSTITGGSNTAFVDKNNGSLNPGSTYTYSVYIKQGTSPTTLVDYYIVSPYTELRALVTWGTTPTVAYSYSGAATASTMLSGSFTATGNGWYRVSMAMNIGTGTNLVTRVYIRGQGTDNIINEYSYAWGAQLEMSPTVSDYYSVNGVVPSTAWNDLSDQKNNATLLSTVQYRDIGTTKSLYFAGANRSLINLNLYNQQYTGKTVFVVARMDTNAGTGVFRGFIGGSGGERNFNTYMYNDGAGWRIHYSVGANYVFAGGFSNYLTTLTTNQWFIIAVSQETNGNTNYYLNGVNVGSFTGYTFSQFAPSTNPEYIGGNDGQWYGDIAYLSLYKKALTQSEIQQNVNALRGRFGL